MSYFLIDVEADGLTPYSGVMTEFGAVELDTRHTFHGVLWEAVPDPACPAKPLRPTGGSHFDERQVMEDFAAWLKAESAQQPKMVSDNPAYDFMWMAYYFDKALGHNPLGYSARRIGDFAAGLARDWKDHNSWKRLRTTKHDHNPVNDALGNAEALAALMAVRH